MKVIKEKHTNCLFDILSKNFNTVKDRYGQNTNSKDEVLMEY